MASRRDSLGGCEPAGKGARVARAIPSLQFRVFRLSLLQDGDVWIGVLPESEEVLVGRAGFAQGIGL